MAGQAFSASMMLADLDFIAPAQVCIKPEIVAAQQQHGVGLTGDAKAEAVKITLQDCLACSGCVTTAETLLVTSQSREEVVTATADGAHTVVVSVSDQSAAALAATWGITTVSAFARISGFVRAVLGARFVTDMRWAAKLSRDATTAELQRRLEHEPAALPLIVSSCPGWVCYCEKTHPTLLPHLCPVMSAQAIVGKYAKEYLPALSPGAPSVYHISVQPCFDKKLEAARSDFMTGDEERGTDCVLSTKELEDWMLDEDGTLPWSAPMDSDPEDLSLGGALPSSLIGSGAFHQAAMAAVATSRGCVAFRPDEIVYETKRNANHRLATHPGLLTPEGRPLIFGVAYGFQHIQNIVRGLKRRTAATPTYAFIELMACPDGCLNGGGQPRGPAAGHREALAKSEAALASFEVVCCRAGSPSEPEAQVRRLEPDAPFRLASVPAWLATLPAAPFLTQFHDRKAEMEKQDAVVASLRW